MPRNPRFIFRVFLPILSGLVTVDRQWLPEDQSIAFANIINSPQMLQTGRDWSHVIKAAKCALNHVIRHVSR